jgi:hypothetical protein
MQAIMLHPLSEHIAIGIGFLVLFLGFPAFDFFQKGGKSRF